MNRKFLRSGSLVAPALAALVLTLGGTCYTVKDWWNGDDVAVFCKGMMQHPLQTGALSPCTQFVAEEMVKYIKRVDGQPLRVLEVGPGIGSFTEKIASLLTQEGDILDLVEINPEFCEILRERFGDNPRITIHCMSIEDWNPDYKHDAIISAVPFNVFDIATIKSILQKYEDVTRDGATLSYIELVALPFLKSFFKFGVAKKEFEEKRELLLSFREKHLIEEAKVYRNIPPIKVFHCKLG